MLSDKEHNNKRYYNCYQLNKYKAEMWITDSGNCKLDRSPVSQRGRGGDMALITMVLGAYSVKEI